MGNSQYPGVEIASAPKNDIEIEHTGSPMSGPSSTEYSFHCLDPAEHLRRFKIAFDHRNGVGEIPSGPADCGVQNDRRSVEKPKFLIECRNCGLDDPCR